MDIVKIKHSLDDWQYQVPGPYISDAVYVSAPSSLAARYELPFNRFGWAMCTLASAANVFDGRIVNYNRYGKAGAEVICWYYRAQVNPTGLPPRPANCYCLTFVTSGCDLRKIVAGSATQLATYTFTPNLALDTWYQFRVTWWQYIGPNLTKLLAHKVEQYKEGAWVELFRYNDAENLWAASNINTVGFDVYHAVSAKPTAIDDTEIWKRTT